MFQDGQKKKFCRPASLTCSIKDWGKRERLEGINGKYRSFGKFLKTTTAKLQYAQPVYLLLVSSRLTLTSVHSVHWLFVAEQQRQCKLSCGQILAHDMRRKFNLLSIWTEVCSCANDFARLYIGIASLCLVLKAKVRMLTWQQSQCH